jgi:YtcA family
MCSCIVANNAMGDLRRKTTNLRFISFIRYCPAFFAFGCNPVIGIAGAQFPDWILCLFVGIVMSLALRPVFVATGIDEWMTPRPLIYACFVLAIAFSCWLVTWR